MEFCLKRQLYLVVFRSSCGPDCLRPFQTLLRMVVLTLCCIGQQAPFSVSAAVPRRAHHVFQWFSLGCLGDFLFSGLTDTPISFCFLLHRPWYNTALCGCGCLLPPWRDFATWLCCKCCPWIFFWFCHLVFLFSCGNLERLKNWYCHYHCHFHFDFLDSVT